MGDIWKFVAAVGEHWVALASGATIVALLGIYEKLRKKEIPRSYYISLLLVFVVVALYQAWLDQHTRVNELVAQLDKERPYFRHEGTQIVPLRAVQAGRAIEGHQVATKLRNAGTSPAQHITVYILVADVGLNAPPIVNYLLDSSSEIGPGGPLIISKHINIPPNARPALLMFEVRYQSLQARDYRQRFFSKFPGSSVDGKFEGDLYEPPLSESTALIKYSALHMPQAKTYETSTP